jgi:hypothetical protein
MKLNRRGQILIMVAILLVAVLFFLAVLVDTAGLMVERHELNRAADAAARAGLAVVGDAMVTQVVSVQTLSALRGCSFRPSALEGATPTPACTATPHPDEFFPWLNDQHRKTLVSPAMRTQVAAGVHLYAENNHVGEKDPDVVAFEVIYPYEYHQVAGDLNIYVRIRRRVAILFAGLLGRDVEVLSGDTVQSIPQKR